MGRNKTASSIQETSRVSPEKGIELLENQIAKAKELLDSRPLHSDTYSSWELLTRNFLEKVFGEGSQNVSSIINEGKCGSFPINAGATWWENHRVSSLRTQVKKLQGLVELLKTEVHLTHSDATTDILQPHGHKVFIVHGHDEKCLHEVARFLEKLKQEIIILREQPKQGRTIIEKFESFEDVSFAVIMLTPDDRGALVDTPYEGQLLRARQNVVFELGFFIGRLGRNRVCALYTPSVEIPSDYSGVLYVQFDEHGAWRLSLAKEMKAAGQPIDMNLVL